MRYATLACGMLALMTHSAVAQDKDDDYRPHDRGVGEWIGFQNYRVPPRYESSGRSGGFHHFDARTVDHGVYYRPFHTSLTPAVRCAPESWGPRGMGNLWNPTCATRRMDYLPYRLRTTETEYGPAYYRRIPEYDCPNGCDACRTRRSYGLGRCHKCQTASTTDKNSSCSGCKGAGCKLCMLKKSLECLKCGSKSNGKASCLSCSADKGSCSSEETSCSAGSTSCTAGAIPPAPDVVDFTAPVVVPRTNRVRATNTSRQTSRATRQGTVRGSQPVYRPQNLQRGTGDQKAGSQSLTTSLD